MARLRCYENLTPPAADTAPPGPRSSTTTSQAIGRWRLVRTPHPQGEKDAISIMRGGELLGSDPEFAGLMIRCGDDDIEVLLVLLRPMPLRARPTATINGTKFEAKVVPPGAAILLPPEVTASARERWPSVPTLTFEVEEGGSTIKGRVVPDDLGPALKTLTAVCATR